MRKQFAIYAAAFTLAAGVFLSGSAAQAQVTLNGRAINYQMAPFTTGTFLMVPLEETLTFLGNATLRWIPENVMARFEYQGIDVQIMPGSGHAIVEGRHVMMGVPALIREGRIFVPLRFLRQELGISVQVPPGYVAPDVRAQVLGFRQPSVEVRDPGAIGIGGIRILDLAAPGPFPTLDARTSQVYERLNAGIARSLEMGGYRPSHVQVRVIQGYPTIFLAGVPLLTVTEADVQAPQSGVAPALRRGMDAALMELARVWADQIRTQLLQVFRP
ncbi:MAG: copper amine oxidase N-terminal domain-containing protein [Armatimonadetes bacterium]|nr:copper amine oxidase N-terminal domain-containing protein [Armatimonadota bacterium]